MWLALLFACFAQSTRSDCGKVVCGEDQYCLHDDDAVDTGGAFSLPTCTTAPDACGGTPTCACLTDCTTCSDDDGLIRCHVGG